MRVSSQWLFTKYDQLGRVIYTGIILGGTGTRASLQEDIKDLIITDSRDDNAGFLQNGIIPKDITLLFPPYFPSIITTPILPKHRHLKISYSKYPLRTSSPLLILLMALPFSAPKVYQPPPL